MRAPGSCARRHTGTRLKCEIQLLALVDAGGAVGVAGPARRRLAARAGRLDRAPATGLIGDRRQSWLHVKRRAV